MLVMGTKKRRERDKEKMRQRILSAAKQLFVKEGFDNVSLRRIAKAIDYSPAAIYRYFKNKREILSVLREEGFELYVKGQLELARQFTDPLERLRQGGRGYIRFALSAPEYFQLMFCTNCQQVDLDGKWAESSMQAYTLFRNNVAECVDSDHFGDIDVDSVVFAMWSGVHGLAHLLNTGQVEVLSEGMNVDSLVDNILEFCLRPGVKQ